MNSSVEQEEEQAGEHDDEQHRDDGGRMKNGYRGKQVNFYFTNFPNDLEKSKLRDLFSNIGEVCDVYVARKMNKEGKKFGFARFLNIENILDFENRLNQLSIGKFNLKVNVAKYEKSLTNSNRRLIMKFPLSPKDSECFNCIQIKVDGKVFKVRIPALLNNREVDISFTKVNEREKDINGMVDSSCSFFPSITKVDFRPTVSNDTTTSMVNEDRKIKVTCKTREGGGMLMPQVDNVTAEQKVSPVIRTEGDDDDDDPEIKPTAGTKKAEERSNKGHVIDGDKGQMSVGDNPTSDTKFPIQDAIANLKLFEFAEKEVMPKTGVLQAATEKIELNERVTLNEGGDSKKVTTNSASVESNNDNRCLGYKKKIAVTNTGSNSNSFHSLLPNRDDRLRIGKGQKSVTTMKWKFRDDERNRKLMNQILAS